MSKKTSKKWPELGTITKNTFKGKDGNEVTKLNFKLADNVTVLVDGEEIELNQYRSGNLITPIEEVEGLYRNGAIGDDKIEERREKAKEVHSWLRYKIQLPPPKVDQK